MTTFNKIGFYPIASKLSFVGDDSTPDINIPLFSETYPGLTDDGIYPYLPFDMSFSFTKPASSPTFYYQELYTLEERSDKVPPYTAVEIYGTAITGEGTPKCVFFHLRSVLKPKVPSPITTNPFIIPGPSNFHQCNLKASTQNAESIIFPGSTKIETQAIGGGNFSYVLRLSSSLNIPLKVKGIASFL